MPNYNDDDCNREHRGGNVCVLVVGAGEWDCCDADWAGSVLCDEEKEFAAVQGLRGRKAPRRASATTDHGNRGES